MTQRKLPSVVARRGFLRAMAAATALSITLGPQLGARAADRAVVRIGYQKAASTLVLLKARGQLETSLGARGFDVKWIEFPAGPQLLEGMNVGSVDFGYVGEAPPVFAQAAGTPFVYVGYEVPTPKAEAVLVPKASAIKRFADLKGKRIAFNKGSDVHWLVLALLKQNGLRYEDIQPIYLAPADARAAFERGAVDAWAIWDPFKSAAILQTGAQVLATGEGVVSHHQFFLASRSFATQHPEVVDALIDEAGKTGRWIVEHRRAAAELLAPIQGLDVEVVETSLSNYAHVFRPIDATVLAEQQRIADAFFDLKLIPARIATRDAVSSLVTAQR